MDPAVFFLGYNVFRFWFGPSIAMIEKIVQYSNAVTLIGGAPVDDSVFAESRAIAPDVVAVDGGAAQALAAGIMPDAVIGDLDSLQDTDRARIGAERIHQIAEQDSTDFDKALRSVDAPLAIAVGFTGARLDHELAVYNGLVRSSQPCIVLGTEDLCFHAPPDLTLDLMVGTRVSLFPMAEVTGRSTGLYWPIDHLVLAPWGRVGTSNRMAATRATLRFDQKGMLVILPRSCLSAAARALMVATG